MDVEHRRRIAHLYHQAIGRPDEERHAFLASACAGDEGLREEVELLLVGRTTLGATLSTTATSEPIATSVEGVKPAPGAVFGSYKIERLLGRGGMASVFLAQDLKHRRCVALKVLKAEIAASIGVVRFLREIEIAARLVHPHILPLFDSGAVGDQLFYVMPHVEGGSLRARLRREAPLPLEEALRLTQEVAAALGHAHRQGFIHRDIKPENILLSDGMALVADFGLARVMEADPEELTGHGVTLGTPRYMSPEQALGTENVGAPADLYSLACVLYEMLAGKPPFTGPTAVTLLSQKLIGTALPIRMNRPEIPDGIERVLEKALAKAPADRYSTAAQFVEGLIASAMGTPVPGLTGVNTAVCHNLPPQRTSFVGRERELTDCARLLQDTRLLTLTGIGGSGKTRLALKLAENLLSRYPDGVWFVDLAPLSQGSGLLDALALSLSLRAQPGTVLTETVCRHVRGKRLLLVLDNCEHLLQPTSELVEALLESGDALRIVVTSREGLGVNGERSFAVGSLPVPTPEATSDLYAVEASGAVQLFVDRARIVDPAFALTPRNAVAVADVCRRLDGIPLAIELAAARMKVLSIEEIRSRLDDRFRLLTGGKKALPRHQTLRSVFEWSYDHLTPDEQRLFRLVSVFAGGWTLAAATALSGNGEDEFDVLERLTLLVDKSMVVVERMAADRVRYRLLETSRQFAEQKLNAAGEGETARRRHLDYLVVWAEAREALAVGPQRSRWLAEVGWEHQNVLAALEWSDGATGAADQALRLVAAVWRYWPTHGLYALGRERLTQALGAQGAEAPTLARARALAGAGRLALRQGALAEAHVLLEEGLSLYRGFGDRMGMARVLNNLGLVCVQEGDFERARAHYQESLVLAREAGDRRGASMCLNNLAEMSRERDDFTTARPLYEEALAEARIGGDPGNVALCLQNLAILLLQMGEPEKARAPNLEALRIVREVGLSALGIGVIEVTAGIALALGDVPNGLRLDGAAEALFHATGIVRDPVNARVQAKVIAAVRAKVGDQVLAPLIAEGTALSYVVALQAAQDWLEA